MNQKNIVLITVLIVALGVITYFLVSKNSFVPTTTPTITNPSSQQPVVSAGNNPVVHSKAAIETIKTGTSFGECGGYCKTELVINSKNMIYIRSTWDNSKPEVEKEVAISSYKWNALIGALDVKNFSILPEVIGCPDCADGGAEWIEIYDGKTTKKVSFQYNVSISGIDPFVKLLREIRKDVSSQFNK